jgi:hypothetical protein
MTCPAAITRRCKTREQVRGYPVSRGFRRTPEGWRNGRWIGRVTATMAASGSMSGCRPRKAPHSSESVS